MTASTFDRLAFRDNEDVLVCHTDNRKRVWLFQAETFSRASLYSDRIEFKILDEDGVDFEDTHAIEKTYQKPYIHALGEIAYHGAVYFEDEWHWNKISVPLPETVEGFRHDMKDHSLGMAARDQSCMEAIRCLALYAQTLDTSDPARARHLKTYIAHSLDYYSFHTNLLNEMTHQHIDPLLTSITQGARAYDTTQTEAVRVILEENGYRLRKNMKVLRRPEVAHYYREILSVLT